MKESELDKRLTKGLTGLPVISIKLAMVGYHGSSGWPDRLVIGQEVGNRQGPRFWFEELKTDKGKLTALQGRRIIQLDEMGCDVGVLYGKEDVDQWLHYLHALYRK